MYFIWYFIYSFALMFYPRVAALLGEIARAQAISPIGIHFSVAWSVVCPSLCFSVVCHIRAPWLNCLTDLHAIWQVHLRGPVIHCVRWGSLDHQGKGTFGGRTPEQEHAIANCCCHLANRNEELRRPARAISPFICFCPPTFLINCDLNSQGRI